MTAIYKKLLEIQDAQTFEHLDYFKDSQMWTTMTIDERSLFARLLVLQGASQLAEGNHQVLGNFEIANQVTNYSPAILYQQGLVFAAYPDNLRCLNYAHQAFDQATQKDSSLFDAWYQGALVLLKIGMFENDFYHLTEAQQKFQKASNMLIENSPVEKEFYWKWGLCLAVLGRCCGEPNDFYRSVEKYRKAEEVGSASEEFYIDYGHALADLASLLDQSTYYHEALQCFNRSTQINPLNFEGWYQQACCLLRLSETSLEPFFIEQADECFAKASELDALNSLLWLKWGQMEMLFGKATRDLKKVEESLNKFQKANDIDPNHPHVLSSWAETELFLGAQHEKLDWIQSAKTKITKSLEINPESPDGWYLYGSCLNELGRYFGEEVYYRQAIEKFQYGLSLTRQNPLLWYGLALAHFAIGELSEDQLFFEKAVHYCSRVIECGGGVFAQFWNDWGVSLMKLAEMTGQRHLVEQAIEKFERALKQPLVDLDMTDLDLEWVYNYGCAYDLLGDITEEPQYFEKSIQILLQILELDPDYVQARYNLAMAYSHLGEALCDIEPYFKAIEHFQLILEQDSEDEIIHMDFGVSLINLAILVHDIHHIEKSHGFYRQAESHLMQSIALGNTQAYYQIAGLYSLTGHSQHTMHYLEKALNSGALPPLEDLLHDEWLEGVRQTPAFKQFINQLSSQHFNDDK
ncbi:tetratricopeptide repeat protein [Candidatus Protochlamydia amoebophila]|uniref:MalT-like TPR region domain-containing protein n=1 Tax=Protochlamydia amoebophila (strain UWE25) TaxID=264201 RepID=A0A2P9H9T3_PARUW|nr:tetratricopeptide repeat protein [Candidatus Protochlamydia amoebophila]SPJ31775.1 unnamed protein product [Candidatus Protochlamydia amoebophila UWE25]